MVVGGSSCPPLSGRIREIWAWGALNFLPLCCPERWYLAALGDCVTEHTLVLWLPTILESDSEVDVTFHPPS